MIKFLPINHPSHCKHRGGISGSFCNYEGRTYSIKCGSHFDDFPEKCPLKSVQNSEVIGTQPTASNNGHTAALEKELIRIFALETDSFIRNNLDIIAKRLNAVIKEKQHCV